LFGCVKSGTWTDPPVFHIAISLSVGAFWIIEVDGVEIESACTDLSPSQRTVSLNTLFSPHLSQANLLLTPLTNQSLVFLTDSNPCFTWSHKYDKNPCLLSAIEIYIMNKYLYSSSK
jgi:hypothetical protein